MTTALIDPQWNAPPARPDDQLARAAGSGDVAAFEALYERHHRALLSFSRHMLGRVHDAEDVVQHTFLAADAAFRRGDVPASVRAWLYTVARNRCVSILRARRDDQGLPGPDVPSAANLAEEVEQREDLRALLGDLRTLPHDQRAALLLAELGELSHAEVAQVLGVRARKVKALVYQARQALMAAAGARAIPCRSIREELAVATGSARRRRHLREHVARCDGCRSYADHVAQQRASLAAILPVVPTLALREGVLACLGGGGAAAATAGAGAGVGVLSAKLLAVAAIGGAAAGGGTVAVTANEPSRPESAAARSAPPTPARQAPATPVSNARLQAAAPAVAPARVRAEPGRKPARSAPARRAERPAPAGAGERRGRKPSAPPGLANRHEDRATPASRGAKPEKLAPARPAGPPAAKPARERPVAPGEARQSAPAELKTLPPGQAKALKEAPGQLKAK